MTSFKSALTIAFLLLPVAALADQIITAPELNPSDMGTAITVLVGLGLVFRSKTRK
jgi:hypothetical protein